HVIRHSLILLTATAPTTISTLSLHDALPILAHSIAQAAVGVGHALDDLVRDAHLGGVVGGRHPQAQHVGAQGVHQLVGGDHIAQDRKSTRLNSSHVKISYAVFCLKKKIKKNI